MRWPLIRRRTPATVDLDEDRLVRELVEILRRAGYTVDVRPGTPWHLRILCDYGMGPCLTSPTLAFDHLMRKRADPGAFAAWRDPRRAS